MFETTTESLRNLSTDSGNINNGQTLYVTIIIVLMYTMIIVVAISGNVAVCYIILSNARMRNVTNLFLLNLAFSDIIKAVICNPFSFVANLILIYWPFGDAMCPIVTYLQTVAVFVSSFTLVAMSLDRFVAVLFPLRPRKSKKRVLITILLIVFVSAGGSLPTAITSKVMVPKDVDPNHPSANGLCLEAWGDVERYVYSLIIMITQYFLPFLVITFTNACIGYVVWIKKTPGEAEADRDHRMLESKRRLVKMLIVICVIYAVCWLPLHAITLAGDRDPTIYNLPYMNVVWVCAHWLAMSHSCYNPFVYFWMNSKFRNGFRKVLEFLHLSKGRENAHVPFERERDLSSPNSSIRSKNYIYGKGVMSKSPVGSFN